MKDFSDKLISGSKSHTVELMPFDIDERIVWIFKKSINSHLCASDIKKLAISLNSIDSRLEFIHGLLTGAYDGCSLVLEEYAKDTISLLQKLGEAEIKFFDIATNKELYLRAIRFYAISSINSADRHKAFNELCDYFQEEYPQVASSLREIPKIEIALEAMLEWIKKKDAITEILLSVSEELGDIIGDELDRIKLLINKPKELGDEFGNILGQGVAQLALLIFGF